MDLDVAQLGQVFTPPNVVAFMLDLCRNKGRVLEPSAGDGAFFDTLRQRGAEVVGIEIDQGVAPQGAQVGDFFAYPLDEQFDTIVGNPPYVRYQDVARETKKHLRSELFDARSNLFLFFMLLLVLGRSLLVLFVGWEGVGLASYLLISYWFKDADKTAAGIKEFYRLMAIPADAVARAIAFAIEQPADVDINEILLRPTAQEM